MMAETTVASKAINPYVTKLADELYAFYQNHGPEWELKLAEHVYIDLLTPKNKRIHELVERINKLEAEIGRLGKVLNRHNAGEWHQDKETAIECAIRLLSPTRDDATSRDRP